MTPYDPNKHGDFEAVLPNLDMKVDQPAPKNPAPTIKTTPYDPNTHGAIKETEEKNDNPFDQVADLAELIGAKESRNDYNLAYDGTATGMSGDFTSRTVDEVLDWQDQHVRGGSKSSAVGRYQIIRKTMKDLKSRMGLKGNEPFDEQMQDKMFVELLRKRGLDRWQAGEWDDTTFANALAKEWASLPVIGGEKNGSSYYAGDGLNKAHYAPEQILRALGSEKIPAEVAETQVAQNDTQSPTQTPKANPLKEGELYEVDGQVARLTGGTFVNSNGQVVSLDKDKMQPGFFDRVMSDFQKIKEVMAGVGKSTEALDETEQFLRSQLMGSGFQNVSVEEASGFVEDVAGANTVSDIASDVKEGNYGSAALNVGLEATGVLGDVGKAMMVGIKSLRGKTDEMGVAGKDIFEKFRQSEASGADMEEVRQKTGWWRDNDGSLQFEIDDSKSTYTPINTSTVKPATYGGLAADPNAAQFNLSEVLDHPELYEQYPFLRDIKVGVFKQEGRHKSVQGFANDRIIGLGQEALNDPDGIRSTLLHEVQHVIQKREGWTQGNSISRIKDRLIYKEAGSNSNWTDFVPEANQAWKENWEAHVPSNAFANDLSGYSVYQFILQGRMMGKEKGLKYLRKKISERGIPLPKGTKLEDFFESVDINTTAGKINSNAKRLEKNMTPEQISSWLEGNKKPLDLLDKIDMRAKEEYYSTLGEANARTTQARADFSPETRKNVSPRATRDIAEEQLMDEYGNRLLVKK